MKMLPIRGRYVAWPLMAVIMALSLPTGYARAAIVTTEQAIARAGEEAGRDKVKALLSRRDVRRQMVEMGVDPDEAAARLAVMSDSEIVRIAARVDETPAGQSVVGTVVVTGLVILAGLLLTDLLGLTTFYPFEMHNKAASPGDQ